MAIATGCKPVGLTPSEGSSPSSPTMTTLSMLHDSLLSESTIQTSRPIVPKSASHIIIPTDRWEEKDGNLIKAFKFRTIEQRTAFVHDMLEYETKVGHHAKIHIDELVVAIKLTTRNIKQITELDKEYAKYSDDVYKDVCYSASNV